MIAVRVEWNFNLISPYLNLKNVVCCHFWELHNLDEKNICIFQNIREKFLVACYCEPDVPSKRFAPITRKNKKKHDMIFNEATRIKYTYEDKFKKFNHEFSTWTFTRTHMKRSLSINWLDKMSYCVKKDSMASLNKSFPKTFLSKFWKTSFAS